MLNIQKNIPLAQYTTFKIGGPAKFFVEVKEKNELKEAVQYARDNDLEIFILGGGSNLLISDRGFDGLVIKLQATNYKILASTSFGRSEWATSIECEAGVNLAGLALRLTKKNLSGLEWAIGIPGATVAGSIRGNAEAFGVSMGSLVNEVEVFDLEKLEFKTLSQKECNFGYRESIFKKKKNYLIWSAKLFFKKKKKGRIDELIKQSIGHRKNSYPKMPSAGSVFKNAISLDELKSKNEKVASYAQENEIVSRSGNVGTGFLVDYLGLKGKQIGGAKISEEHGNFIVNTGNATAEDVIMLMSLIKQKVRDNIGIQLEEEIQLVGF